MSDYGRTYRARLRELLDNGSFGSEPGRERLLRRYLDEWDRWAKMAAADQRLMKVAEKYLWAGIVPSMLILIYVLVFRSPRVDRQFQILDQAQRDFNSYVIKFGASRAEVEATEWVDGERGPKP